VTDDYGRFDPTDGADPTLPTASIGQRFK